MVENTRTTLADISNSLSYLGEEQKTTSENLIAINKSFSNFFDRDKEAAGDESETRRKGLLGRLFGRSPLSPVKAPEGTSAEKASGGGFLGKIFGTFGKLLSPLGALISMLMSPFTKLLGFLRPLLKLVVRGGPIGAVIALLYGIFKDIGDNENFKSTMDSIKTTWASVTERFDNIKTLVSDLFNSEGVQSGIEKITEWWQSFKDVLQGGLLAALDVGAKAIDGALFLIELTLSGSLPSFLRDKIIEFASYVKQKFFGALQIAEDYIMSTWGDISDSISSSWTNIKTETLKFFTDTYAYLTTWIPTKEDIANFVINSVGSVYDKVTGFLTEFMDWFGEWLPTLDKIKAFLKDRFGNTRLMKYLFPDEEQTAAEKVASGFPVNATPPGLGTTTLGNTPGASTLSALGVLNDIMGSDRLLSQNEFIVNRKKLKAALDALESDGTGKGLTLSQLRKLAFDNSTDYGRAGGAALNNIVDASTLSVVNASTTMIEQINSTHTIDLNN